MCLFPPLFIFPRIPLNVLVHISGDTYYLGWESPKYFMIAAKETKPSKESSQRKEFASYGCCVFFQLFGHVLEVFLPKVSPVSVACIFRGHELELCLCSNCCPLKMPATETGETLGRETSRTWPNRLENPQQSSDPGHESLREQSGS